MSIRKSIVLIICLFVPTGLFAQEVFVRAVDSGAALCCVVRMPGDHYMIYDAGNYSGGGSLAFTKVQEIIPTGSKEATCCNSTGGTAKRLVRAINCGGQTFVKGTERNLWR